MPITQDRLYRLLQAGQRYQMAFEALIEIIQEQSNQIAINTTTYKAAWDELDLRSAHMGNGLGESKAIIGIEGWRYRLTHTQNAREKARQEIKRRKEGRKMLHRHNELQKLERSEEILSMDDKIRIELENMKKMAEELEIIDPPLEPGKDPFK